MDRRTFLATSSATVATAAMGAQTQPKSASPLVGIQIAGHSLYDEGIEKCLDLIQETCRANAIFLYSHSYYAAHGRPPADYADHGTPIQDERKRSIARIWVKHSRDQFDGTPLRVLPPAKTDEFRDKDVFADLKPTCEKRGLRLYARILEPGQKEMENRVEKSESVLCIDLDGKPSVQPCRNHPHWKAFWVGMMADVAKTYAIDGYQWGAERVGPPSELLWSGRKPFCFCEHCLARGKGLGIDGERAKRGFRELYEFVAAIRNGGKHPPEGVLTLVLRAIIKYPEILAWDYQWRISLEEQAQATYKALKAVRKELVVGRHLDHQNTSWDGLFAAQYGFADMAPYSDFIKPILYHDILGPRLRWWHLDRLKSGPAAEVPLDLLLGLHYALRGYDPKVEPTLEELDKKGLSAHYVGKETKKIVDAVAGKCQVISGIGIDVPDNIPRKRKVEEPLRTTPESVEAAVKAAFAAGASGILVSREYDEMQVKNLKAIGKALSDISFDKQ